MGRRKTKLMPDNDKREIVSRKTNWGNRDYK